jgi:hypothetical protein
MMTRGDFYGLALSGSMKDLMMTSLTRSRSSLLQCAVAEEPAAHPCQPTAAVPGHMHIAFPVGVELLASWAVPSVAAG